MNVDDVPTPETPPPPAPGGSDVYRELMERVRQVARDVEGRVRRVTEPPAGSEGEGGPAPPAPPA